VTPPTSTSIKRLRTATVAHQIGAADGSPAFASWASL
jgi:hypothetical protein